MNNEEDVNKFLQNCKDRGLSENTINNYRVYLRVFERTLNKLFREASAEDVKQFFRDKEMKPSSREVFKVSIRRFYQWLYGKKRGRYPKQVAEIEINGKNLKRTIPIRPEQVLTKDDIAKLLNSANNFRGQAIVSVLYESAARRTEFLNMNIEQVQFDNNGAVIAITGKTGTRRIRLIESVPYLQQWIQTHPSKTGPLWVTLHGKHERLSSPMLFLILRALGKRAKIDKPMNPHAFRHSRLTETSKFLSDAKQKVFAGWTGDSRMNAVYTHLSGKDLDEDFLKAAGIIKEEQISPSPLKPKKCRRCETENPGPAEFCVKCGLPFDETKVLSENEDFRTQIGALEKRLEEQGKYVHQLLDWASKPSGLKLQTYTIRKVKTAEKP